MRKATVVIPLDLTPATALRIVKEVAADSSRVRFTPHAKERMALRKITNRQVLQCLRLGFIVEGPSRDIHGKWVLKMETISAGDTVSVVAALDKDRDGNFVLIITTY